MQKSYYSNKFAKRLSFKDIFFLFKYLKSAYQKLIIYPVLCQLVKNVRIESYHVENEWGQL